MDRDALARMLEEGLSLEEIGRRAGRHPSTVGYWVAKHGLRAAHAERHAARGGIERGVLGQLVDAGFTLRQIAVAVERSPGTVRHWLREYGLETQRASRTYEPTDRPDRAQGTCRLHGRTQFVRRSDGAWRCTLCRSAAVVARRRRVKQILVEEAGGACVRCGYDRAVAALEFHHLDRATKRFSISGRGITRSLAAAREEAAKCVLLCANCHAEVEGEAAELALRSRP